WKVEAPGGILKAIKFVYGDLQTTSEEGQRAEQELKALSRVKTVRHPYILSLERYDIKDGQLMIVMELADKNLWDRYREARAQGTPGIPRDELMDYMEESAEALDLMNIQYQLQHLDIKPQNIFLVYNHVKVADFGLVKDLEGMVASVTGGVTPVYAAPETFDGMVTRFCDQYSLAIVYQELLTGQRPFVGTNIHQLVMQHVSGKPNLEPLPRHDRDIIARSLSKNPDDRFPSCGDMVRALRNAGLTTTPPPVSMPAAPTMMDVALPGDTAEVAAPIAVPLSTAHEAIVETPRNQHVHDYTPPAPVEAPKPEPPPEETGEGELFPTLVIGLGAGGLNVLTQFRQVLKDRFGSVDALSHLRMIGIDTDPESVQRSTVHSGSDSLILSPSDVLAAKLNRPLHYQKSRDGRPRIEQWFNTNMLYRIPRNLTTEGLRALGRLAFIDNYRLIAQRMQSDLEACVAPENLQKTIKQTGLKLRSNQPRVYVVCSLAGGTGGGMFIDVAYAARHLLRKMGYTKTDVVGLFLLPSFDKDALQKSGAAKVMVNVYTALTELNHFSSSDVAFSAKFDDREGLVTDPAPPFLRAFLLQSPIGDEKQQARMSEEAADYLFRDMLTPLGRAVDDCRGALPASGNPPNSLACQTFGMVRFRWPRRAWLQDVSRRFCRNWVKEWMSSDASSIQDSIKRWVNKEWTEKELGSEQQILRLQQACEKALGRSPDTVFAEINKPMQKRGWFGTKFTAEEVRTAKASIDKLLGQPTASSVLYQPGQLEETLRNEAEEVLRDLWEKKVLRGTGRLLDQPEFKLAGAEEALRGFIGLIDQALQGHEALTVELTELSLKNNERLRVLLENADGIIGGARGMSQYLTELTDLLREYPKNRYQSMILKLINNNYVNARNRLQDQLREVGYCRKQMDNLLHEFDDVGSRSDETAPLGYHLLPVGCKSLSDAIKNFLGSVTAEEKSEINKRISNVIRTQFHGLNNLASSTGNVLRNLAQAMLEEAAAFAGGCLTGIDVVNMYLSRYPQESDAKKYLARAFDEAAPALLGPGAGSRSELCVLALPSSEAGERFRKLAGSAVPDAEFKFCASPEDIVFYREEAKLPLDKLAHLGPAAQDAYDQSNQAADFTPHTRLDIPQWRSITSR
ncbi:MAG: tubulin-like doman-containing protein, partial [Gemmataceae bacterium]